MPLLPFAFSFSQLRELAKSGWQTSLKSRVGFGLCRLLARRREEPGASRCHLKQDQSYGTARRFTLVSTCFRPIEDNQFRTWLCQRLWGYRILRFGRTVFERHSERGSKNRRTLRSRSRSRAGTCCGYGRRWRLSVIGPVRETACAFGAMGAIPARPSRGEPAMRQCLSASIGRASAALECGRSTGCEIQAFVAGCPNSRLTARPPVIERRNHAVRTRHQIQVWRATPPLAATARDFRALRRDRASYPLSCRVLQTQRHGLSAPPLPLIRRP